MGSTGCLIVLHPEKFERQNGRRSEHGEDPALLPEAKTLKRLKRLNIIIGFSLGYTSFFVWDHDYASGAKDGLHQKGVYLLLFQ